MKVAIDAHMVGARETGNETYVVNLIRALKELDTKVDYHLYVTDPAGLPDDFLGVTNFEVHEVRLSSSVFRIPLLMPYMTRRHPVDLLHVNYIAPPWCPCPIVLTVHDISFEFFPEFFSLRDRIVLSTLVPLSVKRSARVIAVSKHTKKDLVEQYGVDTNKITVIYEAASGIFRPIPDRTKVESILRKYGLETGYILAVGNLQPRKNLARLVEAYGRLRRTSMLKHRLVMAGQAQWRASEIYSLVWKLGLDQEIVFTGYVPDQDLPALYCGADLFVYPSLYEGFGLPPLEAMACGTPVITSNTSSLPEVVGDAAILIDPLDIDELAQAVFDVLSNLELRKRLSVRGQDRAKLFSWEKAAHQTLEVYQQLSSGVTRL